MTPEERSQNLLQEADEVLQKVNLRKLCTPIGEITPTGSYFLNLMMYPDIDVYLPHTTLEKFFSLAEKFAECDYVKKINFEKGDSGELAEGLYLKPLIDYGNWGRLWKIDIWSLPVEVIEKKQQELGMIKAKITPSLRKLILDFKFSILTDAGRTPMFSGIHIYRAVINHGIRDFNQITTYLRDNGINI